MRTILPFLLLASLVVAQDSRPVRCRELARQFRADTDVVGLALAVVQNGKLVLTVEAGMADREAKQAVAPSTWFRLGSISKPVTAVGVMTLVEAGKLGLDDAVADRVPEWPKDRAKITLRQLLSHTAGVRHYRPVGDPTSAVFAHHTTAEAVALFAQDPLWLAPGSKESYSTHGFTLVARMVETAADQEFVAYLRRKVFSEELDCEVLAEPRPARSRLYTRTGKEARLETRAEDNSWKYGGGGMEATARGLAQWADRLRAGKLLKPESLAQLWAPATLADGTRLKDGLGWGIAGSVVSHSGAQQGCKSALLVDREHQLSVVVLTNTGGAHKPIELARTVAAEWRRR